MFEELSACLGAHRALSEEETGRVLDQLRKITYFSELNSAFGADYLVLMVPLLEAYVLRAGLALLGEGSQHLLLEGELREEEQQFEGGRPVDAHRLLDLRDKPATRLVAQSDCRLIRIKRYTAAGLAHFQKRLLVKERERSQEMAKLRKLTRAKDHRVKFDFLRGIDFFSSLGEFDLLDLAVLSRLQEYSQGSLTHGCGEEVEAIGCVLSGRVKLSFAGREGQGRGTVSLQAGEGEWVGLEEYLWEGSFRSRGEAASVSATLLWVPREVFRCKFSLATSHRTVSRLVGLVEAKKALFDRSLDCRRRKEAELEAEGEALRAMNAQLLQKISAMTAQQERRKNNFRRAKPQEVELPEQLLHHSHLPADLPAVLPQLFERVNLFPEEFGRTAVSVSQLREMQRLAQIMGSQRGGEREVERSFEQNPETIYRSILSRVPHSPPPVPSPARMRRTAGEWRSAAHSNTSIYNNFRVGRSRTARDAFPKSKTLSILP